MSENRIRELVREMIEQELEEVSTAAAAGPYDTPFAFAGSGESDKKKRKKNSEQAGYKLIENGDAVEAGTLRYATEDELKNLAEGKSKYNEYKNDPSGNEVQKLGRSIAGIAKSLLEMEKVLDLNIRLKNETNVNHSNMWKRTQSNLTKIEKQMVKLTHKIQELKK